MTVDGVPVKGNLIPLFPGRTRVAVSVTLG